MDTSIWLIPKILREKLVVNPDLRSFFDSIPSDCYNRMITEIISSLCYKEGLTPDMRSHLAHHHAKYKITKEIYDKFAEIFVEAATVAGFRDKQLALISNGIKELQHLFVFNEDSLKKKTIKKIDEIMYDIEMYEDYKDVYEQLMQLKSKITGKRRSLDCKQ